MKTTRRVFLKGAAAVAAITVLPVSAAAAVIRSADVVWFDPEASYTFSCYIKRLGYWSVRLSNDELMQHTDIDEGNGWRRVSVTAKGKSFAEGKVYLAGLDKCKFAQLEETVTAPEYFDTAFDEGA